MKAAKSPDDTGPNRAHNFSVRVDGLLVVIGGGGVDLPERDAWRVFLANKLNGHVEMFRGTVVVARIGARA